MSDSHSNAYQKLSDMPLEHQSDFDWNRCPICFRMGVRHELESLSDLACSTHDTTARHCRPYQTTRLRWARSCLRAQSGRMDHGSFQWFPQPEDLWLFQFLRNCLHRAAAARLCPTDKLL